MTWAAVWQWHRHIWKQAIIAQLEENLRIEPVPIQILMDQVVHADNVQVAALTFRRVKVSGTFDFDREIVLRNRRHETVAGGHVVTPLQLPGDGGWVLVDRGFIPLGTEERGARKAFQRSKQVEFFGLVKESMPRKFLAPSDGDPGLDRPWVDEWLRVDIENLQKQLPYRLAPFYLETMPDPNDPTIEAQIVKASEGGRDEIVSYTGVKRVENQGMQAPKGDYPIPVYDTTPPPDIHLGYVYEWAFMAVLTLCIGAISQMPRVRRDSQG